MSNEEKPSPGSFAEEFHRRLGAIISRGEQVGLTVTKICKQAGIARATPDRWRKDTPLSVKLIDKMEAEVAKAEEEKHLNA